MNDRIGKFTRPELGRDLALLLAALLALAFWEWLGADLWLIRGYGTPEGFALQHHPLFC